MPRIVALDLALAAGAAWRDPQDSRIVTRSFVLGRVRDPLPRRLANLYLAVNIVLDTARPDLVSIEDDTGRGTGSRTLRAYHAVAMLAAAHRGIEVRADIGASKARCLALGDGGLSKEAAIAAAKLFFGIEAMTEDEADAAILLVATERALEVEAYEAAVRRTNQRASR